MKTLLFLVMISLSTISNAQVFQREKPVVCSNLNRLLDSLKNNYGEKLDFVVTSQAYLNIVTNIIMYRNAETGSWTIIEYSDDPAFNGEGCILGSGRDKNS